MRKHRVAVVLVGLAASSIFAYLASRGIHWTMVRQVLATVQLWPWLPLGVALYLSSHVVRGVRCRLLVGRDHPIDLVAATNVVVVAYGANNIMPARLGELVRAGMLAERTRMSISRSLGITFVERVLDGLTMLFLLVLATLSVPVVGWMRELIVVALALFGGCAATITVAMIWPAWVARIAARLARPLGPAWAARIENIMRQLIRAGDSFRDPRLAVRLVGLSIVVWLIEAGLYVAIQPVFGIPVSLPFALITMCVTGFGLLLPSSPGGIGPYHYFASQAMIVSGVAPATALAYATVVHLSWYVPITAWGALVMLWYGVELSRDPTAATDDATPAPAAGAPETPLT